MLIGVVAIFAWVIWATASWISPSLNLWDLFGVGAGWFLATVAFEFGFGHYVMHNP